MARRKLTGVGIGTPFASASLSWEHADADADLPVGAKSGCLVLAGGKSPKVRQIPDPIMLGVHPAPPASSADRVQVGEPFRARVPVYVRRDVDEELRTWLERSGFVILVGDSSAGKSRAAFEAISALPDHILLVPQNRDAVAAAASTAAATRRCVLWLDDLERYLGAGGLTRADIVRVITGKRSHRVIVATLRAAEEALLTSDAAGEEDGWRSRRDVRELLDLAHRIRLPRMFSMPEVERARACSSDSRIAEALAHADEYGLAEYLAAGPELLHDWEDGWSPNTDPHAPSHPRGAALVAAAIDLRRGGFISPLPSQLVEQVHTRYLDERGGDRLRPETLEDAWAWATKARRATTALLQPVDDQQVQVFDYLLDITQRSSQPGGNVPDSILETALEAANPSDAENIARTADYYGRYHLAEAASYKAYRSHESNLGAEHRDTLAARGFHADTLRELGRYAEYESEHRAVAEIAARILGPEDPLVLESRCGHGFALTRLGRFGEAEQELSAVHEISSSVLGPDHDVTMTCRHIRAMALHGMGRLAEAEAENRFVLETWTRNGGAEDISTLYSRGNFASVLYTMGKVEEAEAETRTVLEIRTRLLGPEHPGTLYIHSLHANVLRELGRYAECESEHQTVAEISSRVQGPDHPRTLASRSGRAFALIRLGRPAEAEQELRAVHEISSSVLGPDHDVTMTCRHLRAIALRDLGRLNEAEAENRFVLETWAHDYGPENINTLYSRGNLASVLYAMGKVEEAEAETRTLLA